MFLKKGSEARIFSSYEENTLRNILGGEVEEQPVDVLKSFGKEFISLKIQNHRNFNFMLDSNDSNESVHVANADDTIHDDNHNESVHYSERGRSFQKGSKFIRSASNPRLFRQARSQSWNNSRSQSRSNPNQKFHRMVGTSYWYNKDDLKKPYQRDNEKLDRILNTIKKVADNHEELTKKVNVIEEKLKTVNYCEEEVRQIYFTENDKVDYEMIIDSGCPKTLLVRSIFGVM